MEVKFYEDNPIEIHLIRDTFEAAYGKPFNGGNWKWRFIDNPYADKLKIAYIIEKGLLAAFYAVNPMQIFVGNDRQKVALSLMTMTHPEFTKKGLFIKLANSLFQKLQNEGYIAVYGFANSNSHYGFRKYLGWQDIMPLYNMKATKIKPIELLVNIHQGEISFDILQKISKLRYSIGKISITRDLDYLKYRVLDNPIYSYKYCFVSDADEIKTAIIYKFYNNEIDIMEIFFINSQSYLDSLKMLLHFLFKKYEKSINIWSNFNTKEHLELEKIGFAPSEFNSYFGVVPLAGEPVLNDYRLWHIRFLDSDIF